MTTKFPFQVAICFWAAIMLLLGCSSREEVPDGGGSRAQDVNWVNDVFSAVDSGDVDAFVEFMTEDVRFRHGNQDPLQGKEAVRESMGGLFRSIKGMGHELSATLVDGDTVVVHGEVTYTRQDGSTLTVPVADVWAIAGGKIDEYLIFVDNTEL